MYDFIRGKLVHASLGTVVIDSGGIGFCLTVSERLSLCLLNAISEELTVYTHCVLRETEQILFGFASREERSCFRILISFAGIGPKLGLAVLNRFALAELCKLIQEGNIRLLASVPGIGKKTAEKLMVDLKQKLPSLLSTSDVVPSQRAMFSLADEAIQTLISLGFAKPIAEQMISSAMVELPPEATLTEIIPCALKKAPRVSCS